MIKISDSSSKELKKFGDIEWPIANIEHYGKNVDYNEKDFVFKATENGKIVGSVKGEHISGVLYIHFLIVAHDKKGLGIGKALNQKVEDFSKKLKAHKIHLMTGKGWEAEKFWKALGYKQVAVLPKHHFKQDFVIYEKFI